MLKIRSEVSVVAGCRFSLLNVSQVFSDAASGGNDLMSDGCRLHYNKGATLSFVLTIWWKTAFHVTP